MFNHISFKGSLNGTMDNVEDKLDGIGEMNETLKKNSLDINILKFLPYRIDSLDNAIGNCRPPQHSISFFICWYWFPDENIVKIDALDDTIANGTSDVDSLNDGLDQLNNTLTNSVSNLSDKIDEVNITLQETASAMDVLNNSLGKS